MWCQYQVATANIQSTVYAVSVILLQRSSFFRICFGREHREGLSCQSWPPTFLNRSCLTEMLLQREQHHYLSTGVGGEFGGGGVHANGYARKTAAWNQSHSTLKPSVEINAHHLLTKNNCLQTERASHHAWMHFQKKTPENILIRYSVQDG